MMRLRELKNRVTSQGGDAVRRVCGMVPRGCSSCLDSLLCIHFFSLPPVDSNGVARSQSFYSNAVSALQVSSSI